MPKHIQYKAAVSEREVKTFAENLATVNTNCLSHKRWWKHFHHLVQRCNKQWFLSLSNGQRYPKGCLGRLQRQFLLLKFTSKRTFIGRLFFFFYHKSAVDLASIPFVLHLFYMLLLYIGFLIICIFYVAFILIVCSILCYPFFCIGRVYCFYLDLKGTFWHF